MDESSSDTLADPPAAAPPVTAEESQEEAGDELQQEEEEESNEDDELIEKAQKLMEKITSAPDNPNPIVLHALSCILETQESLYMEEHDQSSLNNNRSSHLIGRLGNLIRENDDFFELISSKFLCESRYSTAVQAASSRILLCCSLTWACPHVFEDEVLEIIKNWSLEDTPSPRTTEERNLKHGPGNKEASDSEMLKTYSTGLLAVCLKCGGWLLEEVLKSGLPAELMRYLRIRLLGESSTSHKTAIHIMENRTASGTTLVRGREEGRARVRQVLEATQLDDSRITDIDDCTVERNQEESIGQHGNKCWVDSGESTERSTVSADTCGLNADGQERGHGRDPRDVKTKLKDTNELGKEDLSRCRGSRGYARSNSRGKGRSNEGTAESGEVLTYTGSGSRQGQGRAIGDRSGVRNFDSKRGLDVAKNSGKTCSDGMALEGEDYDDCIQECRIGSKDISDLVKKAVSAAKAEARAANAPAEAVKAAADAAAEVVRSAALEEFKATNDEEAAILAASKAASTVIDAGNATEAFRSSNSLNTDSVSQSPTGDKKEDIEIYFIMDSESMAQLRERYYIQCLEVLGEYVEVLGPVLHEKGVDVCIVLLQRSSRHEAMKTMLLPDVLKLICALAAHRKFSALFLDRGGMQKLLAVPRTTQTFLGLSYCLFTIGSLQGIMERVCALPPDVVHQIVELAIVLLECSQDQARKHAALFFVDAFVFRAVLDAFDSQDGLQRLLGLLNDAASVRFGVNSVALAASGSLRNDRSSPEVLTSSLKQIAYHTCVVLRQYFRAHLLLLVDSIRPNKSNRSFGRSIPNVRAANKPLDISNEAMDTVFLQLQKDRKLGPVFVKTRWPAVDTFLGYNGHIIMLELCQAPPVERYLHDLIQHALGVLHIVTLVPYSRKPIVSTTLSNNRVAIAVILDAANIASNYVNPEIIQPALNVLINLVCPPPSISNKPPSHGQGESYVGDRSGTAVQVVQSVQTAPATPTSGLVGDRRITLGAGAGSAGLAAQLEQGYRQAREAVRANNGIKVLLHLLQPRAYSSPATVDSIRARACRVLLGLSRDDTIAHILTKLQVGKKLSELIRDSGSQTPGSEQSRWQAELSQMAIELIAIVTSGRASTSAASDVATPTLRRIERAAIAAATPISYHSKELLQLIHEHLQASGLTDSAATLLKEAQLTPLPFLAATSSLAQQVSSQDIPTIQLQWPSGRTPCGFLTKEPDTSAGEEDPGSKSHTTVLSLKKKSLAFSPILGLQSVKDSASKHSPASACKTEFLSVLSPIPIVDGESSCKTPIILPLKRKLSELKNTGYSSCAKQLKTREQGLQSPICLTPGTLHKSTLSTEVSDFSASGINFRDQYGLLTPSSCIRGNLDENQPSNSHVGLITSSQFGVSNDHGQPNNGERLTLDSLVVQYLKHQHRQCPAPITTLPPLSLLQPHLCPEPKRSLELPSNITARLGTREFKTMYGGLHGNRRDRQFVYSRFRPWRTCRDDSSPLLSCMAFLGESSHIAVGGHSGELRIFDTNNNSVFESCTSHQSPVTLVQSCLSNKTQLLLSSSYHDVLLWGASSISGGPMHAFEGCKAGRFSNSGSIFAALSSEPTQREICLYDIQTFQLELKLSDTSGSSNARGHLYSHIHFSPSDTMLLWNGVFWDRRVSGPIHRFDQFTDYGGGGFHPAGNEVIINSEVWDLRKFRLLRSVPSLDQTSITFNARGDVIYAILRRNSEGVVPAVHSRRTKHPLFAAFRTVDAVTYSDIATVPVDRCILDFATEATDSFVGLVTMDDQDEMLSSARIYEIGRRRPTDDDSDPDDAESEEEEDDLDRLLGPELGDGDSEGDDVSNDDDSAIDLDDDEGEFIVNDMDLEGGGGILEIVTDGEQDDDDSDLFEAVSSGEEEDYIDNDFGN